MESLAAVLERHRLDARIREAEIIRDYPPGDERTHEARKLVRFTLYDFAVAKIDAAVRDQILGLLEFAHEPLQVVWDQPIHVSRDAEV
jgi:hypothetical protein